jgi:uncharacterized damage-inducible protein DinB
MPSLAQHFAAMAYNNAWANHRLLGAVARLTQAEFAAPRAGFFPSLKATLNHIVTVDWFYLDALDRWRRGLPPNREADRFFEPEEPFEAPAPLAEAQREADRRLVELCVSLTDKDLEGAASVTRPGGPVKEPLVRLLPHLFQHQIHHRGQAHSMLSGTAVAPPQLDEFFCANEAHLRAAELKALGYSEELIWGPRAG